MVKKRLNFCALALAVCLSCVMLTACNFKNLEVAGTYNMSSCYGSVNGTLINVDAYEYFTLILKINGKFTVKSKGKGEGSPTYKASGTYTYEGNKIRFTSKNDSATVTEEYDYRQDDIIIIEECDYRQDGIIIISFNHDSIDFTMFLARKK